MESGISSTNKGIDSHSQDRMRYLEASPVNNVALQLMPGVDFTYASLTTALSFESSSTFFLFLNTLK